MLRGEGSYDSSGGSVSTVNDMNGDGVADIVVGAYNATASGKVSAGKTYVIFGSKNSSTWGNGVLDLSSLRDGQHGFVLQGEGAGDNCGLSVNTAGDVNGDKLSDIIIGAYKATPPGRTNAGKTYVVLGSSNSNAWSTGTLDLSGIINGKRGFVLYGEAAFDYNGVSVSTAGKTNGNPMSSLLMGAHLATPSGKLQAGKSYVVFGAPIYFTANHLSIGIGETVQLNSEFLALTTTRPGININASRVTLQNITNGYFTASYAPTTTLTTCYMQNITDGFIRFVHTGNTFPPQYRVVVDLPPLGLASSIYSDAQIAFLGYRPNLIINPLSVNQNETVLIQTSVLNANDQDNTPSQLSFIISNLTHGEFNVYDSTGALITPNVTEFSLQAVLDKRIAFVHDGSFVTPSYLVAVTDGESTTSYQTAKIDFNSPPKLSITSFPSLILDQKQATTLALEDISAIDAESSPESLIIKIANVTGGYFSYASNPEAPITEFPQLLLTIGTVQFTQNGSNVVPTFTLRASDGSLYSPWQSPQVYLNHRPLLQGTTSAQSATQNENFHFTLPEGLFSDPDVNDTLTYQAQQTGLDATTNRAPLPPEIRFSPPNQFSGNLPTVASFNIEVEARDPRGLTASTRFILSSQAQASTGIDYQLLQYFLSTAGGIVFTVLAYSWLRRRIAMHRRGFSFSNTLRKVLNLEYYDFMRFEGEIYKSKIEQFLQRLDAEHGDFYKNLTEEEKDSFAVCLGQVLINRGLVSQSNCGWGFFGVLCCLNVGWPSQLNLKQLEADDLAIAKEAVDTWKQYNGYKLLPMVGESDKKEQNTIYIEMDMENNSIHYMVIDPGARRGGQQGDITAAQLGLTALPHTVAELEKRYLPAIIKLASKNGHTQSNKAVKKWPYDSPTCWKKVKVFLGCEKSHTATFFAPPPQRTKRTSTGGIELESLEKHEALGERDSESEKPPTFAERLHFLEEHAAVTDARVKKIAQEARVDLEEDVPLLEAKTS